MIVGIPSDKTTGESVRNSIKCVVAASLAALLAACGGGGGSSGVAPTNPAPVAATPIAVQATSYLNEKTLNLPAQNYSGIPGFNTAHAFGDFFQRGERDLFVATLVYNPSASTPATAPKGQFQFWKRQSNGSWVQDTSLLDAADSVGCIHPRKAIVADFNHSGTPGIFVSCHGYDASPFPGEYSAVILPQANGTYKTTFIPHTGYYHGATAFDVYGDGNIDVVATDPSVSGTGQTPVVFKNDGQGNFTVVTASDAGYPLPQFNSGQLYYDIEAIDLNGDGKTDLLFMGDDKCSGCSGASMTTISAPPIVLYNDGSGTFAHVTPTQLPTVPGTLPLDATLVNGSLYLDRTCDDNSNAACQFYGTQVLQAINMSTMVSNLVVNKTGNWIPWLWPYTSNGTTTLVSDDASNPFTYQIPN